MEVITITIIGKKYCGEIEVLGYCEIDKEATEFDIEKSINRLWNEGGGWFENRDDLCDYSWRYGRWTKEEIRAEVEEINTNDIDEIKGKFIPLKIIDPDTGEVIVEEVE